MEPVAILTTVLVLALIGFVVYLITTYIPMTDIFKTVIQVVVAVLLIIWVIGIVTGSVAPVRFGVYR